MLLKEGKFNIDERWTSEDYYVKGRYGEYKKYESVRFTEEEVQGIVNRFKGNRRVKVIRITEDRMSVVLHIGNTIKHMGSTVYRNSNENDIFENDNRGINLSLVACY